MYLQRRFLALALVLLTVVPALGQSRRNDAWVATWATALVARPQGPGGGGRGLTPAVPTAAQAAAPVPPAGGPPAAGVPAQAAAAPARQGGPPFLPPVNVSDQTIRQVVRASLGGSRVRIVLSNAFGTAPIEIGAAHVGLREKEAAIIEKSAKPVMFAGSATTTILPGAIVVSDPVELTVAPLADLAVDLYVPGELGTGPSPVTTHTGASQTNYVSETGNYSGATALPVGARTTSWLLLARVEVVSPNRAGTIVAFGDSITDGARSTPDMNSRWPDVLARRLAGQRSGSMLAVVNAGISGNRVLGDGAGVSALARFDRDVLLQTGVTHVVVMEGINDIGLARMNPTPSAADLIAGHKQLIERAHARGLKILGATLTPFEGAGYWTPEGEAKRQALNEWIRTGGGYDGVIDFDQVTRDPSAPTKFLPSYDSGDHLHPGDVGYKAMGEAVDLKLFKE